MNKKKENLDSNPDKTVDDNESSKNNDKITNLDNDKTILNNNDKPNLANNEAKDESEELTEDEKILEELESLREDKLRLLAEMENLRKRSQKEKVDLIKYGSINFARDVLSPGDNLSRALEALPNENDRSDAIKNLIDGLKMVQKEFTTILEKHGVVKIEALNNKFDHNFHQYVFEIEDDKADPGTVVQEIQSGYTMHDRLLRPTMVGVSKKAEKNK